MKDEGIVRNRLKIDSTVTNARAFLAVQKEFGSFDRYIWALRRRQAAAERAQGQGHPGAHARNPTR